LRTRVSGRARSAGNLGFQQGGCTDVCTHLHARPGAEPLGNGRELLIQLGHLTIAHRNAGENARQRIGTQVDEMFALA
jgi:hypothetical protein